MAHSLIAEVSIYTRVPSGLSPTSLDHIGDPGVPIVLSWLLSAGWPGLLYKVYQPMNDSSGIDVVPIWDYPWEGINEQSRLLHYAGMRHPIEPRIHAGERLSLDGAQCVSSPTLAVQESSHVVLAYCTPQVQGGVCVCVCM